jgi:hypothetical protein
VAVGVSAAQGIASAAPGGALTRLPFATATQAMMPDPPPTFDRANPAISNARSAPPVVHLDCRHRGGCRRWWLSLTGGGTLTL